MGRALPPNRRAMAAGYRSGLEERIAQQLDELGVPFEYEKWPLKYEIPARLTRYTCDFVLPNGILIETKGRFVSEDRKKHRLIKEQYPDLDIRLVFSNPNQTIGKKSTTTYAMWCDKMGIQWAKAPIPLDWINEAPTTIRVKAAETVLGWKPPKAKR